MIEMEKVSSSNVDSIGYDAQNEEVHVRYLNGSEYVYIGVPEHVYQQFLDAPSKGSFIHAYFKNVYPYRRIS